jgi:flagellar assembly factor FliW
MAVTFTSHILGEVEISEEQLLVMPDGLLGFPTCTRFALLPTGRDGYLWLHSVEEPTVAFLIVDPFVYFDGYAVDLSGSMLQRLDASGPSEINVFAIVTLPSGDAHATANLQGPLVFNVATRHGMQAVIQESQYGTRERVPRQPLAAA